MSKSSKSIKFTYLQKLTNQSALHGAYVISITKICGFDESKKLFDFLMQRETYQLGKNGRW